MTLPVRRCPGEDGGAAVLMNLDQRVLLRFAGFRTAAGDLDVAGHTYAKRQDVTPVATPLLFLPECRIVGGVQDQVQRTDEIPGVVDRTLTVVMRFGEGRHQVCPPHSAGSISISAANRSIARSIAAVASGRPAPR